MIKIDNIIVQSWIGGDEVICAVWSETQQNLRVICKSSNSYRLMRFFYSRGVQASVDISDRPEREFIATLLENFV